MNIEDKLVVIIEKEGNVISYEGKYEQERDFIEDYANKRHIVTATPTEIVRKTDAAVLINIGNRWIYGYLPEELNEIQLDVLYTINESCLDDIIYMEINKEGDTKEHFIFQENVTESFENVVLDKYMKEVNAKSL